MTKKAKNGNNSRFYLSAKTPNQKKYIQTIQNNDIVIGVGPAGTGKSFCAIAIATQQLLDGEIDNILVVRTIVNNGSNVGTLPGELGERTFYHFFQQNHYLKSMLGSQYQRYERKISLLPLELIRGHSYDNTFLLLDEAQNATPSQIKLFLTRMGKGSKCCIIGDETQSDIRNNGLSFCLDYLHDCPACVITKLDYSDIQRNKQIGPIIKIFDKCNI